MLAVIKAIYPRFYAQTSDAQAEAVVALWADILAPYPEDLVAEALRRAIKESPFPPAPADITRRIEAMKGLDKDGPTELWNKIFKAAGDSAYHAQERYDELPEACKRFVGSPQGLRALGMMDEDEFVSVTRGQFMKRADMLIEQSELRFSLPEPLRKMASALNANNAMPCNRLEEAWEAMMESQRREQTLFLSQRAD